MTSFKIVPRPWLSPELLAAYAAFDDAETPAELDAAYDAHWSRITIPEEQLSFELQYIFEVERMGYIL